MGETFAREPGWESIAFIPQSLSHIGNPVKRHARDRAAKLGPAAIFELLRGPGIRAHCPCGGAATSPALLLPRSVIELQLGKGDKFAERFLDPRAGDLHFQAFPRAVEAQLVKGQVIELRFF